MSVSQAHLEEQSNLTGTNRFELLLFRLGTDKALGQSELFGINVLKVREIVAIPTITPIAGAPQYSVGVVHLRDQVIPVYDLPAVVGCKLSAAPNLMLVTEFSRSTQAFTVESVEDIVRLEWGQIVSAENSGTSRSMVTSIARIDDGDGGKRLVQILDVEAILDVITPEESRVKVNPNDVVGDKVSIKPGSIVLMADDSFVARALMEQTIKAMNLPYEIVKSGKEAWDRIQVLTAEAESQGKTINDKIALMLTDLEMPEMDGFTLTKNIKQDPRTRSLPVVVHSSLSGSANETHVNSVGADGFVPKFSAEELSATIRNLVVQN